MTTQHNYHDDADYLEKHFKEAAVHRYADSIANAMPLFMLAANSLETRTHVYEPSQPGAKKVRNKPKKVKHKRKPKPVKTHRK